MKFLKSALPIVAMSISSFMFFFMNTCKNGWEYDDRFIDDFFTLLIFSGVIFIGSLSGNEFSNTSKWKYKLITALCSFWMFISSIYHWLTKNEWNSIFIILSLINILAFAVFFFIYAREFYKPLKIFNPTLYIICVLLLLISAVTMLVFKFYFPAIACVVCILLVISTVIQNQSRNLLNKVKGKNEKVLWKEGYNKESR